MTTNARPGNWTQLVPELFDEYNLFLQETGANVEFLLDGAGTPGGGRSCLNQLWRPWNSTYIISNDGVEPMLENDFVNGTDRFQVMNTEIRVQLMHAQRKELRRFRCGVFANALRDLVSIN